jgi:phage-related protein
MAGLGFTFTAESTEVTQSFNAIDAGATRALEGLKAFGHVLTAITGIDALTSAVKLLGYAFAGATGALIGTGDAAAQLSGSVKPEGIAEVSTGVEEMGKKLEVTGLQVTELGGKFAGTTSMITLGGRDAARQTDILAAMVDRLGRSFSSIGSSVFSVMNALNPLKMIGSIAGPAVSAIGSVVKAMNPAGLGSSIVDKFKAMTAHGGTLTTSMEAQAQAIGKQTRAMAVNMGYSGDKIAKFQSQVSGMAMGLGIDAGVAGKAVYAWDWAGKEYQAIGLKSAEAIAKFSEVTGMDANQMATNLRKAREHFGLTDKDLNGLTGSLVYFGQQTGDVGKILGTMPQILEQMGQVTDSTGKSLRGAELANFGKETMAAAAGFYAFYQDGDKAQKAALSLGDAIIKGRKSYSEMFTGANEQFPELLKSLSIAGGNSQEAFKLMNQGPEAFMKTISEMALKIRESGVDVESRLNILRDHTKKALGDEAGGAVMTFIDKADASALKLMATTKNSQADLGKLAKAGWASGKTLAESFEMAEASFITRFRNIGRKEAVSFVQDTTKQFAIFSKQISAVAANGGPLGEIVKRFSVMHQIGVKALLPETLRPIAAVLGTMGKEIGPLLGILGSLGFRFSMLFSPITLLAIPIAMLGLRLADLMMKGKTFMQALEQIGKDVVGFVSKIPGYVDLALNYLLGFSTKLYDWAKNLDFTTLFTTLANSLGAGSGDLSSKLQVFASDVFEGLVAVFSGKDPTTVTRMGTIVVNLVGALVNAFRALSSGAQTSGIGESLLELVSGAFNTITSTSKSLVESVDWAGLVNTALGAVEKVLQAVGSSRAGSFLETIGKFLGSRYDILGKVFVQLVTGALEWVGKADLSRVLALIIDNILKLGAGLAVGIGSLVSTLVSMIPTWIPLIFKAVGKIASELPGFLGGVLGGLGDRLGPMLSGLVETLITTLIDLIKGSPGATGMADSLFPKVIEAGIKLIGGAQTLIYKLVDAVLVGIKKALIKAFPEYTTEINKAFAIVQAGMEFLFGAVKTQLTNMGAILKFLVGVAVDSVKFAITTIIDIFNLGYATFKGTFLAINGVIYGVVESAKVVVEEGIAFFKAAIEAFKNFFGEILEGFKLMATDPMAGLSMILNAPVNLLTDLWYSAKETVSNLVMGLTPIFTYTWDQIKLGIETVFGGVIVYFQATFDRIGAFVSSFATRFIEVFDTLTAPLEAFKNTASNAFNAVQESAKAVFGNSINDYVREDMATSSAAVTGFQENFAKSFTGLPATASEGMTQVTGRMSEDLNASKEVFTSASTSMGDSLAAMYQRSTEGSAAMRVTQEATWLGLQTDFTTSMTAIVTTMSESQEKIGEGLTSMMSLVLTTVSTSIEKLLVDGLVGGFKRAFTDLLVKTPDMFFRPFQEAWKMWTETLYTTFADATVRMLVAMDLATNAMKNDIGNIVFQIRNLTTALNQMASARSRLADERKKDMQETAEEAKKTSPLSGDMAQLVYAVNNPIWYVSYEKVFLEQMSLLRSTLKEVQSQRSSGPSQSGAAARYISKGGGVR